VKASAEQSSSSERAGWAGSADDWGGRVYQATLPSGMQVEYRLPSLGEMLMLGELPTELQEIAWAEYAQPGVSSLMAASPTLQLTEKATKKQRASAQAESKAVLEKVSAINRHLIAHALVTPAMTIEQLGRVPYRDLEMLSMLLNRGHGEDAAGRYVGVVPLDRFRVALAAHGIDECAPDCSACAQTQRLLSQVR
jgi:hypothetical protein